MRRLIRTIFPCLVLTLAIATVPRTVAQTANEMVIYSFDPAPTDGALPEGELSFDSKGNIYGTAYNYGANIDGAVWELSPLENGSWAEQVLWNFGATATDGKRPYDNVVVNAAGDVFGVTNQGGANSRGTVFELVPPVTQGGAWTEIILHDFNNDGTDGYYPVGGLTPDSKGNLFGTTQQGGADTSGTVYELSPKSGGGYTYTIIHVFGGANNGDGADPYDHLVFDAKGNLYGTTCCGGVRPASGGTVFELSPGAGNTWTESILYTFGTNSSTDAGDELGYVSFDSAGNIYGSAYSGGTSESGAVWELSPPAQAGGAWTEQVLHSYSNQAGDGYEPYGGINVIGGYLYGTTTHGGANGDGAVIQFTPKTGGGWTESVFHSFGGVEGDGGTPYAGMLADANGDLFGTTTYGGTLGGGEVFEFPGKPATATALTVTPASLTVGQSTTLKATVTGASGTPTGSVTFTTGSVVIYTAPLNGSGVASISASTNNVPPGNYPVLATYSGDTTYGGSVSPAVTVALTKAPTAVTFTATPSSVTPPAAVTLKATVKRSAAGAVGTPTGTVTFYDSTVAIGTVNLSNGVGTLTAPTTGVPAGSYSLTAKYNGDASDVAKASSPVTVTVK